MIGLSMKSNSQILFLAFAAFLSFANTSSSKDEILDGAYLSGKSVRLSGFTVYFNSNGTYKAGRSKGNWISCGNSICVTFDNGRKRRDTYFQRGSKFYVRNSAGTEFRVFSIK